jgi:hypothetical protein
LRIGISVFVFLLLLYTGLLAAEAQQESVTLRVRADPCVTVFVFDQRALVPIKGERDGEFWTFRVPREHSVEISARTDGTCKVTGILEVARNLLTPGDRTFWYATYDAEFEVRVEKPSLYVTVVGEPRECLSKVTTDPESRVEISNGTARAGPFYRETSVVLTVVPAEKCELMQMSVVGISGSYRASSVNLWLTKDSEVRVTFKAIGAEERKETETTVVLPPPQRPSPLLPPIPPELLTVSVLVVSAGIGSYAVARVLRERRERRAIEIMGAPSLFRHWIRRGMVRSVVLGLLSSEAATKNYSINELLKAAEIGTARFDSLDLCRRGTPFLLTSFDAINSDEVLSLHLAAHLIAAGLVPATFEKRGKLRTELLPRWARMVREGRYERAVEEAREFVRSLRMDPAEALYSEKIREVEAERHPFVQDLIDAVLEELGERVPAPVEEVGRPAGKEEEARKPQESKEAEAEKVEEPTAPPEPAPAVPVTAGEEVELKGPRDLYELVKGGELSLSGTVPAVIVGGAALMAAFNGDVEVLDALAEAVRSLALRITPVDLETEAVYFPAERTAVDDAVVRLTSEEHLACLVADAIGGVPVQAKPNASPVQGGVIVDGGVYEDVLALARLARDRGYPVRIATCSRERALYLASRLGIRAIGVKGLPEVEAALLLSVVGATEPRLFRALTGFSLLVPEAKTALAPRVTEEDVEAAASLSCHIVKGLMYIIQALKRTAAGKRQSAVEAGLRNEMGEELGEVAAAVLELRGLDPFREGLTKPEVIEPPEQPVMEKQEAVQEPVITEPPVEVTPDPDIILAHIERSDRIRADVAPQVVGAVALKASEAAFRGLIQRILSGEITVHEEELPEGIYFPDRETLTLVSGFVEEGHLACVLARALGRGFEADMGGRPSGRRIVTWSEERAFELSSLLGLPVFRIEYLPQLLAYRVLASSGKRLGPAELRLAVGFSLVFEGLPDALLAGSLREALAAVSPCGRHKVPRNLLTGLMSVDLARLMSMGKSRAIEELRTRTGLNEVEAERLLELLTAPLREGSLEPVAVGFEPRRKKGILELAGEALRAAKEGDRESLSRILMVEMIGGEVEDDRPPAPAIYYPEGDRLILDRIAVHTGSDHLACLVASSLSVECVIDKGYQPEEVAEALRSGKAVAVKSRERARELASSIGAEAIGVDIVTAAAASVLSYWSSAELPPIPELFLAVTSASLFYPELPERLQKVDPSDLQSSLVYTLMSMVSCHKPDEELKRAYIQAMPLAAISAPYAKLVKEVGELAQLIYLRPPEAPRPAAELEAEPLEDVEGEVEVERLKDWLKLYLYPDGYYEFEVDDEKAPYRAAVQLGDGERYEAPADIPVRSSMDVRRIDKLMGVPALEDDTVLLVPKIGHGIKMKREYEERLMDLMESSEGKLVAFGFFDDNFERLLERKDIEVIKAHRKVREQAERGARRLLGEGAEHRVFMALTNILMLFPRVARVRGRTRGEVTEEASRTIGDILRSADDGGYISLLSNAVRVLIGEKRLLRPEEVPPRMRRVAETLGLLERAAGEDEGD